MTQFVLVRHGEPTYDEVIQLGFKGHGIALAPLTENGIQQVKGIANHPIFQDSDILISSPYTRTMQTAQIIASQHHLDIHVEVLLHEWLPDLSHNYHTEEEFLTAIRLAKYEWEQKMIHSDFEFSPNVESLENVRKRALQVLEKYCDYHKVIVVTHGLLISMLFTDKIRLKTGDFIMVTSDELEKQFDFHPKQYVKK